MPFEQVPRGLWTHTLRTTKLEYWVSESQNHIRLEKNPQRAGFTPAKYIRISGVGAQASVLLKLWR